MEGADPITVMEIGIDNGLFMDILKGMRLKIGKNWFLKVVFFIIFIVMN